MAETEDPGGARIGSGLTDATGAPDGKVLDHATDGLDLLLGQFKGKPRIEAFIRSLLAQVQDLEDTLWDLFTKTGLETAEGVQLDTVGKLVGEIRGSKTDAVFRRFIRVRILVNKSDGRIEDLYAIGVLALQGIPDPVIKIYDFPVARMILEVHTDLATQDLSPEECWALFNSAKPAGVRLDFVFTLGDSPFIWGNSADGPQTSQNHGWASTDNLLPGAGGYLASIFNP